MYSKVEEAQNVRKLIWNSVRRKRSGFIFSKLRLPPRPVTALELGSELEANSNEQRSGITRGK